MTDRADERAMRNRCEEAANRVFGYLDEPNKFGAWKFIYDELMAASKAVRNAAIEEAAVLCDQKAGTASIAKQFKTPQQRNAAQLACWALMNAIRALKERKP